MLAICRRQRQQVILADIVSTLCLYIIVFNVRRQRVVSISFFFAYLLAKASQDLRFFSFCSQTVCCFLSVKLEKASYRKCKFDLTA